MTALALDGPLNASYITDEVAKANGYVPSEWPTGEQVYIHSSSAHIKAEADEPMGLTADLVNDIVAGADIR